MKKAVIGLALVMWIVFLPVSGIASDNIAVTDGFESDLQSGNQPEVNGTYSGTLFETIYIPNILEPGYSSSPTADNKNAIAIEDGIGVDGSAGMRMTTTTRYSNDDVRAVYQYTRAFDLTGGKEMIYGMQFKFNAVPANVNGRLLRLFFSDGTSKTESNVITFNHYQFTCGSNTYRYQSRSDGVEYIGNNRWFTLEALIKTSGTSYTVTSSLKDYTGNIVLTGETTGTVQNADYFKNVRIYVGTARGYAVNGEPLGFEMVIDDCSVIAYSADSLPELYSCNVADGSVNVLRNIDISMLFCGNVSSTACIVKENGVELDSGSFIYEKGLSTAQIRFKNLLNRSSSYDVIIKDDLGNEISVFSFTTEAAHIIDMSVMSMRIYNEDTSTFIETNELIAGKFKADVYFCDPLCYPSVSGVIMPVLYKDDKMIWSSTTEFNKVLDEDGCGIITIDFTLPSQSEGASLCFLLFDYDEALMPISPAIIWK